MALWSPKRRNGLNGRAVAALPAPRESREEYDGADIVWRCSGCGSMGTSQGSMWSHSWKTDCDYSQIRVYVPREVYDGEFAAHNETRAKEVALSGVWIVVKMSERTEEGSVSKFFDSEVIEAKTGLAAIQDCYAKKIANLDRSATEADREKANGRYVAIDFFTGLRSEALVTSEWRANVEVAEGSHR